MINWIYAVLAGIAVDVSCINSGNATVKAFGLTLAVITFLAVRLLTEIIDELKKEH